MASDQAVEPRNGESSSSPARDDKPPTTLIASDAPISTTKALQLSIVFPRVHQIFVAGDDDDDDDDDDSGHKVNGEGEKLANPAAPVANGSSHGGGIESSSGDPKVSIAPQETDPTGVDGEDAEDEADADAGKDIVGYVEGEDEEEPVEHVVTAEEMAHVVKIQKSDLSADEKLAKDGSSKEEPAGTAMDKVRSFFGVVNKDEDGGSQTIRLTKEQSVAALKRSDSSTDLAPNTEIRVEALVKLTFKALLEEGHLFNAPSYGIVKKDEYIDGKEWMQLTVMIKAASIGTALERLERIGVGSSVGTVCVHKAELLKTAYDFSSPSLRKSVRKGISGHDSDSDDDDDESVSDADKANMEAARAEWKNAASRLRVEQVKEQIHESAALSLDFLSLLTIASILAGIGLITDSTVVIVASMLVSPIMGPVMGMTFGSRVCDWNLAKWSAVNELLSLLVAVAIGACIALTSSWTESASEWPTNEMLSRGETSGLVTGIAIAIPSGMGVALSIIGNNTSSLVGVAISASLLPPAVNAGICWFHAILLTTGAAPRYNDEDFVQIGGISFALTVVNIVCIWVAGIAMFKIKEVAPTKAKSAFWSRDIKVARNVNKGGPQSNKVDTEVIREGLKEALRREQRMKRREAGPAGGDGRETATTLRWRKKRAVRRAAGPRSGVTFNLAVNPVPYENIQHHRPMDYEGGGGAAGGDAGLGELVEPFPVPGVPPGDGRGRGRGAGGVSRIGASHTLGASAAAAASGTPLTDDVRYVGLEDMAALLGFDEEDDEQEEDDAKPPARPNGWGLGWFR